MEMNKLIALSRDCPFCKKTKVVFVFENDLEEYNAGSLVQNCFPYLSASQREIFISGICSDCWDKMFSE